MTVLMGLSPSSRTREFRWARKSGPFLSSAFLMYSPNGLGRSEVEPDTAVLVAFLVERDGRLVAVLVEVVDLQATAVPIRAPE